MKPSDLALAQFSEAAYKTVPAYSKGGVDVVLITNPDYLVVAFQGTKFDYKDILRDIRGVPWYDKDMGWCHSGFLKGVRTIWPYIRPLVNIDKPVYLTGHSKGGAEATICAAMMTVAGYPPAYLVTFGSPRVGFKRLSEVLIPVPSARYVHGNDCVPDHPYSIWGYRHIQRASFLDPLSVGNRFEDHRISRYIGDLGR